MDRNSSGGAGVVLSLVRVPMLAAFQPRDRANAATRVVTLVLPLVPVTPTSSRCSSGLPTIAALARASSARN